MGHHYVPQRYQRNFECPDRPGFIWLHDKQTGGARRVSIKRAAQARDFYEPDMEKQLADEVEAPANPVIGKLIKALTITTLERRQLSLYVGTMLMRVPANRRKQFESYPGRLADYCRDARREIEELASTLPDVKPEFLTRIFGQLEEFERASAANPSPEMVAMMLSPLPFRNMVEAIGAMTWRVMVASGPQYFITSDNPAFFFESYGLGRKESELSFPLSTTHALHGSWQHANSALVYVPASQNFVREVNRRLASTAERFALYHEKACWLLHILAKPKPYLSVLHWSKRPTWREPPPSLMADGQRHLARR